MKKLTILFTWLFVLGAYNQISTSSSIPKLSDAQIAQQLPSNFLFGITAPHIQTEESIPESMMSPEGFKLFGSNKVAVQDGCLGYQNWSTLVDRANELGTNAYQLSISWARIQPLAKTEYNQEALDHYTDYCKKLHEQGQTVMVTLCYYDLPIWFVQQDGFEKKENIQTFVEYCQVVYQALNQYVDFWIVMHQPAAYAQNAYVRKVLPPCKQDESLCKTVTKNVFAANIAVAQALHKMHQHNPTELIKPVIGLSHQVIPMHAFWDYSIDSIIARKADQLYNQDFFDVFKPYAHLFNFFALSFYSSLRFHYPHRYLIRDLLYGTSCVQEMRKKVSHNHFTTEEKAHLTQESFRFIDPQGLYDAIKRVNDEFPMMHIIVTETGISPAVKKGEHQRIEFLKQYLSTIVQARQDQLPIQGFFYHTLMHDQWACLDKEQTAKGEVRDFGLFDAHTHLLKAGGKYYQAIIQATLSKK